MAEFTLWTLLCFFIAVTFSTGEASLKVTLTANVTHGLQSSAIYIYGMHAIHKGIVFQCNISSDEDLTDYLYDIQWFINDNSIVTHRNIPYTNLTQTGLHQSEWTDTYTLGFLIKCAVRARSDTESTPTPYTNSDAFYAGFEAVFTATNFVEKRNMGDTDLPEYTVPENGSINITIRLTVPIDYMYPENLPPVLMDSFMRDHYISLRLRSPYNYNDIKDEYECAYGGANNEQISFVDTRCSLRFDIYKWNAPTNITIYGLVDGIAAPISSRTSYIRLTTDIPVYSPAFSQVTIPDIKVTVLDENIKLSGRTCSIPTGPFINTFDGRQVRFLQYGEFVVFIHNALPIRIHAVFDRCWHAGQGSCTCGIAIRNMDAVFVLNFCKENIGAQWQHLSNVNRYVELKVNGNDGMEIEYRSSTYKVTLPSGTVITIGVHIDESHAHINAVVIKPSVADWKTTSGMCGFLDGNPDNDIRLRSGEISEGFGISWRRNITLDGSSLFVSDIILMDMPLKPVQYCSCPEDDYRSRSIYPVAQCNMNPNTAVCPKLTNVESQGQQYDKYRAKKALGYLHRDSNTTEDDIEVSIHDVIMDEKYQNNSQNITWTNDWNESLAEEACRNTLDSDPMLIKCKDAVSGMDDVITNGIYECIVNIMIFGQTWYMEGTLKALQEHCLAEAEYLVTHESHGVSKAVLDELKQLRCSRDCSGNGNCIYGTCHCHTGFYGNACTLERDTVPGVLSGGMICWVDKKPCKNFVVAGSDFLNASLTCLVRPITVYSDRWEIVGPSVAFRAKYVNDFNCICNIPEFICRQLASDGEEVFAEGYLLSVSNDGDRFSNETAILSYDSRCYECDATHINCTKSMETCLSTGTFNTTVQPTEPYPLENETGPPNVTMTVEVTHGIKTSSMFNMIRKEIVFHCNITTDLCITDHVYDIQWFINDNGIVTHRNIPYTNLTQTGLRQSEWTGTYKLGFLVKCAVRARTDTDSTPTPYTYSDDFYAGFTTDQSEYSVPEDSSINITIRLSVPLDCIYLSNSIPDCSLKIRIKFPKHYDTDNNKGCTIVGTVDEPIAFGNTACGIFIKYSDWDVPKNMTIYGSADNIVTSSRSRTSYVRLVAEESFTSQAWASATIPDIKVNALDEDKKLLGKSCTIQTDPHINTFDGSHVLFMQYGEFILFKHDTLPIRIHAVFDKCWQAWRGACTCGVAIRYIDAVFVLNFCKVRIGAPWLYSSNVNRYVEMRACDATHMTIEYRRPAYKVTLPSGTEIHIGLHLGAINTHINMFILKPSLADWEATSGMCGFLDGDKNNDIRLRSGEIAPGFGVDWRHDNQMDGESLFASNGVLGDILLPQLRYCRCPVTSTQESGFAAVANCDLTSTITTCGSQTHYTNYFEQCSTSQEISGNLHRVVRRSTNDDFEIPKFDIALDENYAISEYNITWINSWNESLAEEACRNTMDSDPMLIRCKDAVAAMNDISSNGINECVGDVKISGHTGYMEGTLEALREHCLIEAIRFENLTTQESHRTNTTFLNELLKLNCPNNCSGNGHCEKGVCDCQDGFYGDSCTLGIETIPEVLSSGMICSIEKRSCRNFVIPGSNFLDVNLTCQVRMLKVYINRWEIIASPVLFPATYLNDFNCVCTIPDSYRRRRATDNEVLSEGYLLSISNDGIHFSKETTILTYDSSCYDCDPINMNCSKLEESCDLTTTPTGTSEPSTLTDNTFTPIAILGCVIGIVVILGIVIAVGIIIKLKWFHVYNTTNTKVTELCNMSFNEKNTRVQNNIAEPSNADYHFNENRLTSKVTEASPIDGQVFDDPMMVIDLEEYQPIGDKGDIVS